MNTAFTGLYAAAVTPYDQLGLIDPGQFARLLEHLKSSGCDGVLISGTTGEAASLSVRERGSLFKIAAENQPGFKLIAGTGSTSLDDAVELTRAAFDLGFDAVLVIPPFFFATLDALNLADFFKALIDRSVPRDGKLLLYHNPTVCDVPISHDLIRILRDLYPDQVIGMKESSTKWEVTEGYLKAFPDFSVLTGTDQHISICLASGGAGAITGMANFYSAGLRDVFNLIQQGQNLEPAQKHVDDIKSRLVGPPRIAAIKTVMKSLGIIDNESVRLPLRSLTEEEKVTLLDRLQSIFAVS
jgi:4-hydroxy-tetrahydrodipicolinate synthase